MISFRKYLLVEQSKQTLKGSGHDAERHMTKYMNVEKLSRSKYTLAKDHGIFKTGTELNVSGVTKKDDKYHAVVQHNGQEYHVPVSKILKPHDNYRDPLTKENFHFDHLKKQIDEKISNSKDKHILIRSGNTVHKVTGIVNVPGTPKADFALVNHKGEEVHYISHKDTVGEKTSGHGYGGISHSLNTKTVKDFTEKVKEKFPNGIKGTTVAMRLDPEKNEEHKSMVLKTLYGHEYGGNPSRNNVDEIHHGKMNLHAHEDGSYSIHSDDKLTNGEIPHEPIRLSIRSSIIHPTGAGIRIPYARASITHRKPTHEIEV